MKKVFLAFLFLFTAYSICIAQTWNSNYLPPVGFYTPCDSILIFNSSDSSNIWQEGSSSSKTFFGLNGTEDAIMTDSMSPYAVSNHSYFDLMLPFQLFNYPCTNVEVRFLHKMETDAGKDGGYITWSPDLGVTWLDMFVNYYQGVPWVGYQNLYYPDDTFETSNGYAGFNGLIDTFLETRLQFIRHPPEKLESTEKMQDIGDTILVRFNFVSDSVQTNKAGWIIKKLQVIGEELGGLAPSIDQTTETVSVFPNPSYDGDFEFSMNTNELMEEIKVYNLTGQEVYSNNHIESQKIKVQLPNNSATVYFYSLRLKDGKVFRGKLML